jgi:hypothetical protein
MSHLKDLLITDRRFRTIEPYVSHLRTNFFQMYASGGLNPIRASRDLGYLAFPAS